MKILQDIWIVERSGIVIFHREFDKVVSPQLFGAMMSALNMFAEQLAEGGMSNFELENSRFTIIKTSGLIFVANSSKKYNQKKVNKELKKISEKFIKLYSDKLVNFKGQIGAFSNFKSEIKDALEQKPL
ncbi:MAG: hypothetical protein KAT57_03220 [Candidatus Lokiarchaeota archaeon]|nr:hypothetical protein [Candidatus Lokiarchaeota archaeon]MCK4779167.1 hypothetical protein [Candidatus Lokiarchaeota archaeon]